ncbi:MULTISPECIES: Nramp family divalent metal transporter [Nocardioides]|uniref:Nramp family divalent metal transporter n=1 Tax=Nocardioides vastitatis TaxID=2568655 RepID=A0ABW0ZF03_9ACTN|nr:Nramp family divalent metal transporter [Nocardioides sp.]
MHILGPTVFLLALGVGMGESFMWPRLVVVFGPDIRWFFLIGVSLQAVVMLEMARYAMATGESIFTGAARVFKPLMWFFFATAIGVYIWPGHMSAGAGAFENLTGIPWQITGTIALVLVAVVFTAARVIYDLLEKVLGVLIGCLVIGTAIIASMVGSLADLGATLTGMFAFGYFPDGMMTAAWFPVVVGSIAFAGPSGMQQMWYTLHLRESGAAMGAHIPKLAGVAHARETDVVAMPARGFMFDTEDPVEMEKWKGWRKWITFDALFLFWGVTMLVTVSFTVMAMAASRQSTTVKASLLDGDRDAALPAMADAFSAAGTEALGGIFLGFIALIGLNATLGLFDSFSRGQADMVFNNVKGAKKIGMPKLYGAFLWGVVAFGIIIVNWGPADGPGAVLDILAFLSTFAMGAYCVTLLLVNNRILPKPIRPGIVSNVIIGFAAVFYLGMLLYSVLVFGVADMG